MQLRLAVILGILWLAPAHLARADEFDCNGWLTGITAFLKQKATESWGILSQSRDFHMGRFHANFPAIRRAFVETWRTRLAQIPEAQSDLTTDQAVALLETLRTQEIKLPRDAKAVYARPFTVQNGDRKATALVKESHTRTKVDAPTAIEQVTVGQGSRTEIHSARWEVMAFKLDRYLGMNLVPPATMISREQSAQLVIRSGEANYRTAIKDPAALLDLSMIRMLDAILSNGDRFHAGNFRVTATGRALAVDFDLSSPVLAVEAAVRRRLLITNFPIAEGVLGRGHHPGVYSRRMIERLENLTGDDLFRMAEEGDMLLTRDEAEAIYSGARTVAVVVRKLAAEYGEDLVWID